MAKNCGQIIKRVWKLAAIGQLLARLSNFVTGAMPWPCTWPRSLALRLKVCALHIDVRADAVVVEGDAGRSTGRQRFPNLGLSGKVLRAWREVEFNLTASNAACPKVVSTFFRSFS